MFETGLSAGGLATLVLELVKWIYRNYVIKNPTYNFPEWVYVIAVPTLTALLVPALALLGLEGYQLPTDWVAFVRNVIVVALGSLVSLVTYNAGLSPLKEYGRELRAKG